MCGGAASLSQIGASAALISCRLTNEAAWVAAIRRHQPRERMLLPAPQAFGRFLRSSCEQRFRGTGGRAPAGVEPLLAASDAGTGRGASDIGISEAGEPKSFELRAIANFLAVAWRRCLEPNQITGSGCIFMPQCKKIPPDCSGGICREVYCLTLLFLEAVVQADARNVVLDAHIVGDANECDRLGAGVDIEVLKFRSPRAGEGVFDAGADSATRLGGADEAEPAGVLRSAPTLV